MAKFEADLKYVASIWPGQMPDIALNHGPSPHVNSPRRTVYKLKPVPRNRPPYSIEIHDSYENVLDLMGGVNVGSKWQSRIVPVDTIVRQLLKEWAGGLPGVPPGAAPGIIEVVNRAPSTRELDQMREQQTIYAEFMWAAGREHYQHDDWKGITEHMRLMALWLGKHDEWADPAMAKNLVSCPHCFENIHPEATVCKHCGKVVRPMSPEMALLNQAPPAAREPVGKEI